MAKQKVETKAIESASKFPSDRLALSNILKEYGLHRDVIRAILKDEEYSLEDARKEIQNYINSFNV